MNIVQILRYYKNIKLIKVVNIVTLDYKTDSSFKSYKSNFRKLLKQSIICSVIFFYTRIKDIEKPKKIRRSTLELLKFVAIEQGFKGSDRQSEVVELSMQYCGQIL